MFEGYEEERDAYEDELYQETADSSVSEGESELEFQLYSQVHYASCPDRIEAEEEEEEVEGQPQPQPEGREQLPTGKEQFPKGVIVIDSGPEIITVSDSSEEEEGVCVSKCSTLQRLAPTSGGRPHAHAASPPVVLGDESEDSDSDSDSDGLESWMVLGQEKQESDKSIQLNFEGGTIISSAGEEDDGQTWAISRRDLEAGIYNKRSGPQRVPNRYYTSKSISCRSCDKTGHLSKNCPNPKKLPACSLCGSLTHLQRACPNRPCSNCSMPGHCYDNCRERPYWHKHCHRCGMTGHFYDVCPDIWRQYHLTTQKGPIKKPEVEDACRSPAYCYNCSRKGHFGFECEQRRMFNGTFPTAPYISYYDKPQDIWKRDKRARRKAEELQKAGLLQPALPEQSTWSQAGNTEEGPPRKKVKTKNKAQEKKRKGEAQPAKAKKVWKKKQQQQKPQQRAEQQQQGKKLKRQKKKQAAEGGKQPHGEPKAARAPAQNGMVKWPADDEDFPRGFDKRPAGGHTPPQKVKPIPVLFQQGKNRKKRRARGRDRKPGNRKLESMYPTDENLFIIKQRRKR